MHRKKLLNVAIVILAIAILAGCPFRTTKQSNSDLYYTALGFWQSALDNFKIVYGEATPETRKDMVPTMQMLLNIKRDVLNTWAMALSNNDDAGILAQNAAWKKAKNRIIIEVVNKYFPDKGGV